MSYYITDRRPEYGTAIKPGTFAHEKYHRFPRRCDGTSGLVISCSAVRLLRPIRNCGRCRRSALVRHRGRRISASDGRTCHHFICQDREREIAGSRNWGRADVGDSE